MLIAVAVDGRRDGVGRSGAEGDAESGAASSDGVGTPAGASADRIDASTPDGTSSDGLDVAVPDVTSSAGLDVAIPGVTSSDGADGDASDGDESGDEVNGRRADSSMDGGTEGRTAGTGVDRDFLWIDPAARYRPLGALPWYDQGCRVVLIREDGTAELHRTPASRSSANGFDRRTTVRRDSDGRWRWSCQTVRNGEPAAEWREELARISGPPEDQLRALCTREVTGEIADAELTRWRLEQPEGDDGELRTYVEFTSDGLVAPGPPWPSLVLSWPDSAGIGLLGSPQRRFPLDARYPQRIRRSYEVSLEGTGYGIQVLPTEDDISNHDLVFSSRYATTVTGGIRAEQDLEVRTPTLLLRNRELAHRVDLAIRSARGQAFGLTGSAPEPEPGLEPGPGSELEPEPKE